MALGAHLLRGDRAAADRELERYVRLAEEVRRPVFLMLASAALASRAIEAGEFDAAERHLADAVERARGSVPYADALRAGHRLWLDFQRGDLPGLGAELPTSGASLGRFAGIEAFSGLLRVLGLLLAGSAEEARHGLDEVGHDDFTHLERDEHWMVAMGMLAIVVAGAGDRRRAETLYASLLPFRHLMVSHDLMRSVASSAETPLGVLALVRGRPADAVGHFEAAQVRERAMGLRPALVRSGVGLAVAFRLRGEPGDAERADRVQAAAQAAAERLGIRLPGLSPLLGNLS
jgi:hypothetical protein